MNGPFVVAQAGSSSANSTSSPVQIIKIIKPQAGQTEIFHASFTGVVKIDFTAIANLKVTFYHDNKNQSLHIIFADGSQAVIEPFFDSMGVLSNLLLEMGPGQILNGLQFAAQFPITTDQSVLPAAGDTGDQASGANFSDPSVDALLSPEPLPLLLPEELPPIKFTETTPAALFAEEEDLTPTVVGKFFGVIEEEQLNRENVEQPSAAGDGNEDINDVSGYDDDASKYFPGNQNITQTISGTFAGLVVGGDLPITFLANSAANGATVKDGGGNDVTSIGETVQYIFIDATTIEGWTSLGEGGRLIFTLHVNPDGSFTFELNDQIDHPIPSYDDGTNPKGIFEETLNLDLSNAVVAHDATPDPISFPAGTIEIGVIDDTPVVVRCAHECAVVDEDDVKTFLSHGTSPNDGNADGSFTGNPWSNGPGPAFVCGSLSGLVRVGADAVDNCNNGTFSFNLENFQQTICTLGFDGLRSKGDLLSYSIEDCGSFQKLIAVAGDDGEITLASSGGEGEGYERIVFILTLFEDGKYEFRLFDQMDHDPPHDDLPFDGLSFIPGSDQNFDLEDNVPHVEIKELNFGALINFSDYDHDTVSLDGAFAIKIRDDVPEIKCGEPICLTVNEDDIKTFPPDGSLGTSPNDGPFDGSWTGSPFSPFGSGPATVFGKLGGLFGVVESGTDECLTFSFINAHLIETGLGLLGLSSKGDDLRYDVQDNILYAYVGGGGGPGYQDGEGDRLVFKFTLQSDGDFKFELFDQLDHDPPNDDSPFDGFAIFSGSDQNVDLQDDVPFYDVASLNFGLLIKATDYDGDSVILKDQLIIKIKDDVPEVKYGEQVGGVVEEEQLAGGNEDGTPNPYDQDPPANDTTNVAWGLGSNSLASLIKVGADEKGEFSFKHGIYNDVVKDKDGNDVTSGGKTVKIKDIDHGNDVGGDFTIITAKADGNGVFTLKVWENGTWKFTLLDQLDHHPYGDDVEGLLTLDFSNLIEFTDFDGDSVCLNECSFLVKVIDDIPIALDDQDSVDENHVTRGNVITGVDPDPIPPSHQLQADSVGTDNPGTITKIVHNGVTYTLSGDGSTVSSSGAPPVSYDAVTGILTLATALGGQLALDLKGSGAGDYIYTAPTNIPETDTEQFVYTLTDSDGDNDDANLAITVNDVGEELSVEGVFSGAVEEEQLQPAAATEGSFAITASGNEDVDDASLLDTDTDPAGFGNVTNLTTGTFSVSGGDGSYVFKFDGATFEGTQVQKTVGGGLTSGGDDVLYHELSPGHVIGYVDQNVAGYDSGDRVIFSLEIDSGGNYTFALYDKVDHPTPTSTGPDSEENISINLNNVFIVDDEAGETALLQGSVAIIDDTPVAADNTATVSEGGTGSTNFLLIFDTSASMLENPGVPGFVTRLDLEKAAAINLLNSANVNQVFIVGFNSTAFDSGGWLSKAQAINFINFGLFASGNTNYDAALTEAETAFAFAHTGASQTLAYFLSDGVPNLPAGDVGIDAAEQATWENFLNVNGVAAAFAVGIGSDVTTAALDPIAYPNGDPDNPIVLTDQSQLSATLTGSLPGSVDGNVLDNDGFGADGAGAGEGIISIMVDGHLYAYDALSNAITKDGGAFGSVNGTLDINTTLGGHFTFHFTSGVGFDAGDWRYLSPADVVADTVETFHYVIGDGDGDQIGADLNVTVTAVNDAPVANDDSIITNIAGSGAAIAIPDLALLLNDVDPDGPALAISSVGGAASGSVDHAAMTTFTDNDLNGGSFDYTMQDGGIPNLSDTAHVTVNRSQAGESQLDGSSSSEILIGRAGSDDTLVGGGGSDVQFGGTGDDHFRYNATNEGLDHILDFGSGIDVLEFDHTAFGNGLASGGLDTGTLDGSHFVYNGTGPTSVDQKFWYNTNNNTLYFDADGSNAGAAIAMAKLENAHALGSGEIHMV